MCTTGRDWQLTPNNMSFSLKCWEIIQNLGITYESGRNFRPNPVKPEGKLHQLGPWRRFLFPAGQGKAMASVVEDECEKIITPSKMSCDRQAVKCVRKHPLCVDRNLAYTLQQPMETVEFCLLCDINLHICGNLDVLVEDSHLFSLCSYPHHLHPVLSSISVSVVFCYSTHIITTCLSFVFTVYGGSLCYICSW